MDFFSIILSLFSAFLGTFFGAWLVYHFQNKHLYTLRKLSIRALKEIRRFSQGKNTYKKAEGLFNTEFDLAQKRAILTALFKVGLPIDIPKYGNINISNIEFQDVIIDKDLLDGMISNINHGYCDKYFDEDISSFISTEVRTGLLRDLAKRFVDEVVAQSTLDGKEVNLPKTLLTRFTNGERRALIVFREFVLDESYFDMSSKRPDLEQLEILKREVDMGLWDSVLTKDTFDYMHVKKSFQILTYQENLMRATPALLNSNEIKVNDVSNNSTAQHENQDCHPS